MAYTYKNQRERVYGMSELWKLQTIREKVLYCLSCQREEHKVLNEDCKTFAIKMKSAKEFND